MVDEGQFREMTLDSVESCHVCIVYVHSNPDFFLVLFSLVLFISSVGFVAMNLCSQCDQLFRPSMSL